MEGTVRETRTREYLIQALVEIVGEKSVRRVQVRELCERAQVNRSTFYKHYDGMDGFLTNVLEAFHAEMDENLCGRNVFEDLLGDGAADTYLACVRFMSDKAGFVRAMMGPNGMPEFKESVVSEWEEQFHAALRSGGVVLADGVDEEILCRCAISLFWCGLEYTVRDNEKYAAGYVSKQLSFLLHDCLLEGAIRQGG